MDGKPGSAPCCTAARCYDLPLLQAYFYFGEHGLDLVPEQYAWLEADLAAVDRSVTPWIIAMSHRPMYCSPSTCMRARARAAQLLSQARRSAWCRTFTCACARACTSADDDADDCHSKVSILRDGLFGHYGMEELLYKYGVEVFFGAHEHSYERNYPVYNFMWNSNVTGPQAYVNFDRPIHILSGAGMCTATAHKSTTLGTVLVCALLQGCVTKPACLRACVRGCVRVCSWLP